MNQEARQLEERLEKKRQELSDVRALLAKMERSESYSIMSHRFQLEKDQLRKQVKQWAMYRTAKQVLEETKLVYQQEYLPKAMVLTSRYFSDLTNGRYRRVFLPEKGSTITVEDKSQLRFKVNELSKGTRDQLYISLRFALNEMMNDEHAFPFFIDDGFVHFDRKRTEQVLKILQQTAQQQQVILFTCQPLNSTQLHLDKMQRIELA